MVLEESVCLSLVDKLSVLGLDFLTGTVQDIGNLLDQLFKVLLQEKGGITVTTKLNVAAFIELESSNLLTNIADVELTFATFKNVFESSVGDQSAILRGQSLISSTTILLQAVEKWPEDELEMLFSEHINILLTLVKQNNNASNVYVRSVAANCLVELELCFPNLLGPCLDSIYTASVVETSTAHQQYMTLLSLIVKHSLAERSLSTPLWGRRPQPQLKSSFVGREITTLSFSDLNQIISFLMDQLPLCTCEGMVWTAAQLISMMISRTELQASAQVLKPLLFNYAHTYNVPAFHIVLMLEKKLGNVLFQEQDHNLLLQQLLLNSSHPALPACTKLIYLDYLGEYLTRRLHKAFALRTASVLLLGSFDGPETQLKKLQLLSVLMRNIDESSKVLLQAVGSLQKQMRHKSSIKLKSTLVKTLYRYLGDHQASNIENEVSGVLLASAKEDVTIAPFVLNFVQKVQESFPGSSIPLAILTSLVAAYTKPDSQATLSTLHFVLDIFLTAVLQSCSLDQPKAILTYLLKYVVCDEVFERLSWRLGHQILLLCYNVMKEYDTVGFFYELCDVLKAFTSKCGDVDQQDRAQLYYALLISLSNKKLKAVLKAPKQILTGMISHDSTFNSNTSIQSLIKPVVRLRKVNYATPFAKRHVQVEEKELPTDVLHVYNQYLDSAAADTRLILRVAIDFVQEFDEEINMIEAVAIFFSLPESWGRIEPIMVGHLDKKKIKTIAGKLEDAYAFDVVGFPAKPHPVLADVRSEFSIDDVCHTCPSDPLNIEFSDFFSPLPVPGEYACTAAHWRTRLFRVLWQSFESGSTAHRSVHVLHCKPDEVRLHLNEKLDPFLVDENSTADNLYLFGIYLPPANHLLMKFQLLEDKCIITMITDDLHVLAYTNAFIQTWG